MTRRLVALALVALFAAPSVASAGGFYLTDRGTRALGRGGAFVGGADDPAALYYNPAGLMGAGRQLLMDASMPLLLASYKRVDSGGNPLPRVDASQVPLPIPTLAVSETFGLEHATFGLGLWAPNAALLEWPDHVTVNGQEEPAPQRYSLLSLRGTLLTNLGLGVGVELAEGFSLGVTGILVSGTFGTTTTMSACDGFVCTQPENPDFDSVAQLDVPFFVAPTASFGALYASDYWRVGASFDLPYAIRADGRLRVRLPSASIYEDAFLEGSGGVDPDTGHPRATARMTLPMPWVLRAGIEARVSDLMRVEAAFVTEGWSRQDYVTLRANDVWIRDVVAIGDYEVGRVRIPRHMRNTYSIRFGGEIFLDHAVLRGGLQYETSAFARAYLTPFTLDSRKWILSGGLTILAGEHVSLDGTLAYSFMNDVTVTNSAVPQVNPIRPEDQSPAYVGNGNYRMDALVISAGLRVRID